MIKKIFIFSILTLCIVVKLNAQSVQWAGSVPASYAILPTMASGQYIATDNNGFVYITGFFTDTVDFDPGPLIVNLFPQGSADAFIVKLDVAGNLIWAKAITGIGSFEPNDILIDSIGNIVLTGKLTGTVDIDPGNAVQNITSSGATRNVIAKIDPAGDLIWYVVADVSFGTQQGWLLTCNAANDLFVLGQIYSVVDIDPGPGVVIINGGLSTQLFVMKLNDSGIFQWATHTSGKFNSYTRGMDIALDKQGNIYSTGFFRDSIDFNPSPAEHFMFGAGFSDTFLWKLDSIGNFQWAQSFGSSAPFANEHGAGLAVDDSFVFVTGSYRGNVDFDYGTGVTILNSNTAESIFLIKLNTSGNLLWAKSLNNTSSFARGKSIVIDCAKNIYLNGMFNGTQDFDPGPGVLSFTSTFRDGFIGKYTPTGDLIWAIKSGATVNDEYISLIADKFGSVYAHGYFEGDIDLDPGANVNLHSSPTGTGAFYQKFDGCFCYVQQVSVCSGNDFTFPDGNIATAVTMPVTHVSMFPIGQLCDSVIISYLSINELPQVVLNSFNPDTICINSGVFNLPAATPSLGIYSGPGVTGIIFDPMLAGIGTHTIYYSYTDSNQCTAGDSAQVFVDVCTNINELDSDSQIYFAPNPATDLVCIKFNRNRLFDEIIVWDYSGRRVFNYDLIPGKDIFNLQINELPQGVYFIEFRSKNQSVRQVKKLVKI